MLPAILAAKPALKYGVLAGLIALIAAAYFGWKEYQQYMGREEERTHVMEGLMQQNEEAKQQLIIQSDLRQKATDDLAKWQQAYASENGKLQREIDHYARTNKTESCREVSPEFVRVFDAISGVRTNAVPAQRVPASDQNPGQPEVSGRGSATPTGVLRAYNALKDRYERMRQRFRQFDAYDDARYQEAWRFYMNQQVEQAGE